MAEHPLEPLTENEFRQTAAALRRDRGVTDSWRFAAVELSEPPKSAVLAWRPGDPIERVASAVLWNRADNTTWEARVDLVSDTVPTWRQVPDACPNFTVDEYHDVDHAMRAHPDVVAALAGRGIADMSLVLIEVWTYAKALMPQEYRDRRLGWCDVWYRRTPDGNPYAHPVSGLKIVVDMSTLELLEIEDDHDRVDSRTSTGEYVPEPCTGRQRTDLKPLHISQPEGVSFTARGNPAALAELAHAAGLQPPRGPGDLHRSATTTTEPSGTSRTGSRSPRWSCPTATRRPTTTAARRSTSASGGWAS